MLKACRKHLDISMSSVFGESTIGDRMKNIKDLHEIDLCYLIYGCYMEPYAEPRVYDEADNYKNVEKLMHYYLREYNNTATEPMDLILFHYAIEHISRCFLQIVIISIYQRNRFTIKFLVLLLIVLELLVSCKCHMDTSL